MKNLAGLNLDLILANVLNCSTLFVSGDDQKSGLATGYARLAAAVREMSPRIPPPTESTAEHGRILLLVLTNPYQITAHRSLSCINYLVSSDSGL